MIKTQNLTKVFGSFKALDDLNLDVGENEIFGFLGPNGSGKTTTINLLMGMLQPTSGSIRIAGIDVLKNPLKVKKICGYMPEQAGFYDNLTARQNLLYFLEFYGSQDKERVDDLIALVGLSESLNKKVGEFSKGMKQRLNMAQALISDPQVIFMDEPTASLDPRGVKEFREIIRKLAKEGKTIFFSSHILSEVRETCGVIGIMSKGKLIVKEKLDELESKNIKIFVETEPVIDEGLVQPFASKIDLNNSENGSKVVIESERDCRTELSNVLFQNGYSIKEIRLIENLEDTYLKAVGI